MYFHFDNSPAFKILQWFWLSAHLIWELKASQLLWLSNWTPTWRSRIPHKQLSRSLSIYPGSRIVPDCQLSCLTNFQVLGFWDCDVPEDEKSLNCKAPSISFCDCPLKWWDVGLSSVYNTQKLGDQDCKSYWNKKLLSWLIPIMSFVVWVGMCTCKKHCIEMVFACKFWNVRQPKPILASKEDTYKSCIPMWSEWGKCACFLWINNKFFSVKLKAVTMASVTIAEGFLFQESVELY